MKHAEIEMHFVTPAFLSGADQTEAEFRAPSVRGLLRWWTRALGYSAELEKTLFGSAGDKEDSRRSAVMIRDTTRAVIPSLFPKGGKLFSSYILWPYEKRQGAQKFYSRKCIAQGARVSFSIQVRKKGVEFPEEILKSFLLLGALGSRSRRCYGSIWPDRVLIDGTEWKIPTTEAEFSTELEKILDKKSNSLILALSEKNATVEGALEEGVDFLERYRRGSPKSKEKEEVSYWGQSDHNSGLELLRRSLHKAGSCWGRSDHNSDSDSVVYRQALGLPLFQRYTGSVKGKVTSLVKGYDRLASPLHLKIIPLQGGFVPLGIFFFDHLIPDGTEVELRDEARGTLRKPLSNELLRDYMADDENTEVLGDFRR